MAQLYQPIKGCLSGRDVTTPNVPVLDRQHVGPARFDPTFADSPTPPWLHRCRRAAACAGSRRSDRVGTHAVALSTGRPGLGSSRRCGQWRDQRASTPVMVPVGTSEARSPVALLPLSPRQCTLHLTSKAMRFEVHGRHAGAGARWPCCSRSAMLISFRRARAAIGDLPERRAGVTAFFDLACHQPARCPAELCPMSQALVRSLEAHAVRDRQVGDARREARLRALR